MDQQEIDRLTAQVRAALSRGVQIGDTARSEVNAAGLPDSSITATKLVTEATVREAKSAGRTLIRIAPGTIVTPLAKDALRVLGVSIASAFAGHHRAPTRCGSGEPSARSGADDSCRPWIRIGCRRARIGPCR